MSNLAAVLLALAAGGARPGSAGEGWLPREGVAAVLAREHGETPRLVAVTEAGTLVELFGAARGEGWTLVETLPNGLSRVIGAGTGWVVLPEGAAPKGEGS